MQVEAEVAGPRGKLFRMNTGQVFEVVSEFGWVLHATTGRPVDHPDVDEVVCAVLRWREEHPLVQSP